MNQRVYNLQITEHWLGPDLDIRSVVIVAVGVLYIYAKKSLSTLPSPEKGCLFRHQSVLTIRRSSPSKELHPNTSTLHSSLGYLPPGEFELMRC
jgi:hypothetical protein